MSKDARQKLRDMGGIMASSPDLMQAVQKFNNGGPIMPPAPPATQRPMMPFPLRDPILTDDYFFTSFRRGELPRQSGPDALPTVNSDVSLRGDVMNSPELRRQVLASSAPSFGGTQTIGSVDRAPLGEPMEPILEDAILNLLETTGLSAGIGSRKPKTKEDLLKEAENLREQAVNITMTGQGKRPGSADVARQNLIAKADDLEQQATMAPSGASSVVDMTTPIGESRRGAAKTSRSIIDRNVESLEGPEATGLGGQFRPDDTPTVTEDDTAPAPDETLPPMITNDPEGTASEALSSLDKSYDEKLALFQKVFGDGDEDKSRDRAMSLAMIGLAIAAGQSPNALTNIAQGAMVGLNAMGEQRKERQAKKERVKVMALDAALKEHQAQQEFARELGLEAIKAGNKSQYRDTPTVRQEGAFGDVEVFLPTPQAAQQGVQPIIADVAGLDRKYMQSLDGRQKVFGMVDQAEQLIEQYDIAGFEGAMARFKQDFSAATPKFLKEAVGFDGTSGTPTPQQQYDTLMRAMAAQFTPIILGESGRTISDGDRQRVAQILGFAVDQTTGKIDQYEGTAFTSEAELKSALSEVRSILGSSYSEMDRIYSRYRPEQYGKLQENNQKQTPSNRMRFDINGNPME